MTTMINGKEKLKDVSTAYRTKLFDAFYKAESENGYQAFTVEETVAAKWHRQTYLLGNPAMEEWDTAKTYSPFRAFDYEIELTAKHRSTAIELAELYGDSSEVIATKLRNFLQPLASDKAKLATTKLLAADSTVGADGVNMCSESHPFGAAGATQSNYTTDSLSPVSLNAGIIAMQSWTDEDGNPLGMSPTKLVVGPKLHSEALKLVNAMRSVALNASGAEAVASVVAATTIPNNFSAYGIEVVLNRRITGYQWFLVDDSKPGLRPIVLPQQAEPKPTDNLADYKEIAEGRFSVEWIAGVGFGPWFTLYGSFAVS